MRVHVNHRADKPQGFEDGKLAKHGKFACFYNCGDYFSTQEEAKRHEPCPKRKECDKTIEEMKKLAKKKQMECGEESPNQIQPFEEDVKGEQLTLVENPTEESGAGITYIDKKHSVFDELPVENPEERVIRFLSMSEFTNGY